MTSINEAFIQHFLINFVFVFILSYGCYFRVSKNTKIASSLLLFGVGIFSITKLLHSVDISMGFAFGLFAVFTMLRYRTEPITIKEMTYLFMVIAIALLSAVGSRNLIELSLINGLLCFVALLVDSSLLQSKYSTQNVIYEKIENIKPENRGYLESDLISRTGLNIVDVRIDEIDFLRDTAKLTIHYLPQKDQSMDEETEIA